MISARAIAEWLFVGMCEKAQMLVRMYSVLSHMISLAAVAAAAAGGETPQTDCGGKRHIQVSSCGKFQCSSERSN
jgi:hypothetical protein